MQVFASSATTRTLRTCCSGTAARLSERWRSVRWSRVPSGAGEADTAQALGAERHDATMTSKIAEDKPRCSWAKGDPLMRRYHDEEWGVPGRDGRALWELLMLEGFQAGLAW